MSLLLLMAALALGAPPPLVLATPRDGGWVGPRMDFVVRLDGGMPYGTLFNRVEYRVLNTDDSVATSMTAAVGPLDDDTARSVTVPLDAGLYRWTARTLDSSDASVWAPPELFRWDGVPPPASAFITIDDLDAGGVRVSYGAIVDDESGLAEYHPAISFEGAADAGIDFSNAMLQTQQLTSSTWLGPGTWRLAVHGHDRAGNVGTWTETPPIVVTASAELGGVTPSTPQLFFSDGGPVPLPAVLNSSTFRGRWTSPFDGGVFVVGRRHLGENLFAIIATRLGTSVLLEHSDDGLFEVQVAHALDGRISQWSQPVQYHVDQSRPFTPALTASVDGGLVSLRWNGVNDRGSPASGVALHALTRLGAGLDASVLLATFDAGAVQYQVDDVPGAGASTYTVRVLDVAGNISLTSANVFIGAPPALEAPQVTPAFSRGPVDVSWDAGGLAATFEVSREDGAGAATVVSTGLAATAFLDPAPEGAWRYRVRARVTGVDGPLSNPSAEAVVDLTAPLATLDASRRSANVVEVRWTATDALSGVATVTLEREAAGVVTSLGVQTATSLSDTPPDGAWRYRVVVVDRAGNVTTTPYSAPVQVPGSVIRLDAASAPPLECYREAQVSLTSSGEPAMAWELVSGPEGARVDDTGTLRWTPRNADVGRQVARVRVSGTGSADEGDVTLEVTCQPRALRVGCEAAPMLAPVLLAAWVLARRRR